MPLLWPWPLLLQCEYYAVLLFNGYITIEPKLIMLQRFRHHVFDCRYPGRDATIQCLDDYGSAWIIFNPLWYRVCPDHHTSPQRKIWPVTGLPGQLAYLRPFHPRCWLLIKLWGFGSLSILRRFLWRSLSCIDRRYFCRRMVRAFDSHLLLFPELGFLRRSWLWSVLLLHLLNFAVNQCLAPLVLGYVVTSKGWQWTQFITLMIAFGAYLFGIGVPETYPREILRARARRLGHSIQLAKAQSGVTLAEMAETTLSAPLFMAVSEPIVMMVTLYLALNFAVLFQWVC